MGALGPIIVTVVIVLVISAVVGAVAQFMNKINDAAAANRRPAVMNPRPAPENPNPGKPVDRDMDRFLAEIDRLRRKNAPAAAEPNRPAVPVVQPVKPPDRPKPRVVAEVAEPRSPAFPDMPAFPSASAQAFPAAPQPLSAPSATVVTRLADLPVATIVPPSAGPTMPATRVTAPARRPTVAPKTDFGKAFASLLGTGKGAAMAVVLTEVLGTPKSKKR